MIENLKKLYGHYGGIKAVFFSSYFWISIILTFMSYGSVEDIGWVDKTLAIMPSLAGFTIAAFAIIFAIIEPGMLRKLNVPNAQGRSPISTIAASIGHAVFIQVCAILLAISCQLVDIRDIFINKTPSCEFIRIFYELILDLSFFLYLMFSAFGLFFTYYGVLLVLAAALSIVRMQIIVAKSSK